MNKIINYRFRSTYQNKSTYQPGSSTRRCGLCGDAMIIYPQVSSTAADKPGAKQGFIRFGG